MLFFLFVTIVLAHNFPIPLIDPAENDFERPFPLIWAPDDDADSACQWVLGTADVESTEGTFKPNPDHHDVLDILVKCRWKRMPLPLEEHDDPIWSDLIGTWRASCPPQWGVLQNDWFDDFGVINSKVSCDEKGKSRIQKVEMVCEDGIVRDGELRGNGYVHAFTLSVMNGKHV